MEKIWEFKFDGKAERGRLLLLSVPDALKAGDAETVGGYPPSAFVLATPAVSSNPIAPAASNERHRNRHGKFCSAVD